MSARNNRFQYFNDRRRELGVEPLNDSRSRDLESFPSVEDSSYSPKDYLKTVKDLTEKMNEVLLEYGNEEAAAQVLNYRATYFEDFNMVERYENVGEMLFDDFMIETEKILNTAANLEKQLEEKNQTLKPHPIDRELETLYDEILDK